MEVCITLLGELLVNPQRRIALLSNVDVGLLCRTRRRGHQGGERSRIMREGIRDKMVLSFGMNNRNNPEEVIQKSSPAK